MLQLTSVNTKDRTINFPAKEVQTFTDMATLLAYVNGYADFTGWTSLVIVVLPC